MDVLPRLGSQPLRGGVEHEEAFVDFEESHDTVRCGHCETDSPGEPVQIRERCISVLDGQERGNGEAADGHGDSEHVEQRCVDNTTAAVFIHQKSVSLLEGVALKFGKIAQFVEDVVHVIGEFHRRKT